MIVNITTAFLIANASFLSLSGRDVGYLTYNDVPIQVAPDSSALEVYYLNQICSKLNSIPGYFYWFSSLVPLYKLTTPNVTSGLVYRVNGCTNPCYDLYLECKKFPFRLDDSGDLRLSFESNWSALCFKPPLRASEATVFCTSFKLPSGNVTVRPGSFGTYGTSWMLENYCSPKFGDRLCFSTRRLTKNACSQSQLVGIECNRFEPVYRFVNWNKGGLRGTLQFKKEGQWRSVCSKDFTLNEAKVTCRSFGYPSSNANYFLKRTYSKTPPKIGSLRCKGNETALRDCAGLALGYSACETDYMYIVEISCNKAEEGDLRLAGGYDGVSGRLEIYHNYSWGTICDNSFGSAERSTVCTQITKGKLRKGTTLYNLNVLPKSSLDDILLDRVRCGVIRNRLDECSHLPWKQHSCSYNVIVFMSCSVEPKFQLSHGDGHSGRLEVFHDNQWGKICNWGFGDDEVIAACKTLGLPYVMATLESPPSTSITDQERVWLDSLQCGSEITNLTDCVGWRWGKIRASCSQNNDVYISCRAPDRSEVRYSLEGTISSEVGFVRMEYGYYLSGEICMKTRSEDIATVACRSLGLPYLNAVLLPGRVIEEFSSHTLLNGVQCNGNEDQLIDCQFDSLKEDTSCAVTNRLAVACGSSSKPDYSLRLRGGPENGWVGRLEVSMYGVWGTVCSTEFRSGSAEVACRQMGLPTDNASTTNIWRFTRRDDVFTWLYYVSCQGYESSLELCSKMVGGTVCSFGTDVALSCLPATKPDRSSSIIGGAFGGSAAVVVAVFVTVCVVKRRSRNRNRPPRSSQSTGRPISRRADVVPRPAPPGDNIQHPRPSAPPDVTLTNIYTSFTSQTQNPEPNPPELEEMKPPPSYYELYPERNPQLLGVQETPT